MKKSLLGCTALIALGGICTPETHAVAASVEELQQEKRQLLKENAEYLHLDLGSITNSVTAPSPAIGSITVTTHSTIRDDIVRAGFNYRIGP
jgi:hypothetical protein